MLPNADVINLQGMLINLLEDQVTFIPSYLFMKRTSRNQDMKLIVSVVHCTSSTT